jgi:hypothetical protein
MPVRKKPERHPESVPFEGSNRSQIFVRIKRFSNRENPDFPFLDSGFNGGLVLAAKGLEPRFSR